MDSSVISEADTFESFCSDLPQHFNSSSTFETLLEFKDDSNPQKRRSTSTPEPESPDNADSPPKKPKPEIVFSSCAPLINAIKAGNFNEVQDILHSNPQLKILARKENPLHLSIENCHIPIVRLLLTNGFNPDAADYRGVTPIQLAVEKGQIDLVQLLLEYGANTNVRNKYGFAIIHNIVRKANPAIPVVHLDDKDALSKELCKTMDKEIFENCGKLLETLLRFPSVDINLISKDGKTALYYAVVGADCRFAIKLVNFLLSKGADPNVKSTYDKTALSRAMTLCRVDIIKSLLENGASTEIFVNDPPVSPIVWGITRGRADITELLLKYSTFNVNDPELSENHPSLLHHSIARASAAVTRCLINAGANITFRTEDETTPLLYRCSDDSPQAEANRRLLLEHLVLLASQKLYEFSEKEIKFILEDDPSQPLKLSNLELHLRKLQNEMIALKAKKIPGTKYTFYDFAAATDHSAAKLIKLPPVVKYCSERALQKLFPAFCRLMCDRFKAGLERTELLRRKDSIENLKKVFFSHSVKTSFVESVMRQLINRDLKHLLNAYDKLALPTDAYTECAIDTVYKDAYSSNFCRFNLSKEILYFMPQSIEHTEANFMK